MNSFPAIADTWKGGKKITSPSPHVPIENALQSLIDSINNLADARSVILPNGVEEWEMCKPISVHAVTESFQKLEQRIRSEIASDQYLSSPVREILAISTILRQITHQIGNLNKKLTT